jgi:uncharacterized membrane protein YgcG
MKKAADYYKELEKTGKAHAADDAFRKGYVERMRKKPFPVKWVLLAIVLCLGALIYYRKTLLAPAVIEKISKKYPQSKVVNMAVDLAKDVVESDLPAAAPMGSVPGGSNAGADGAGNATNDQQKDPMAGLIFIEGKYYKKTPDNIYIINGKRVFYVDNRGKSGAAAATGTGDASGASGSVSGSADGSGGGGGVSVPKEKAPHEKLKEFINR